jgi:hypothetical protein
MHSVFRGTLGLSPWLRQTVKTLVAFRCKSGSPQEFGWTRILGGFPEDHAFGPRRSRPLSL